MPPDAPGAKSDGLIALPAVGHRPPLLKPADGHPTHLKLALFTPDPITIVLTHFWRAKHLEMPVYSIVDKQPVGFEYPVLSFFVPNNREGKPLLETSSRFKAQYDYTLKRHAAEISEWLENLAEDIALVDWCVDTKNRYRAMRCARILIAKLIHQLRPDIEIKLDFKFPNWKWRT